MDEDAPTGGPRFKTSTIHEILLLHLSSNQITPGALEAVSEYLRQVTIEAVHRSHAVANAESEETDRRLVTVEPSHLSEIAAGLLLDV